jgi:hypothetical protein
MSDDASKIQAMPTRTAKSISVLQSFSADTVCGDLSKRVFDELQARVELGIKKYNSELMTDNGRDALLDAKQEALDGMMYSKQLLLENPGSLVAEALLNDFIFVVKRIHQMEDERAASKV